MTKQKKTRKLPALSGKVLPGLINPKDMKAFLRAAKESQQKTLPAWVHRTLQDAAEKQ